MLDAYVIDFIREEERRKQEEARIPLYIHPPGFDGYVDNPYKPKETDGESRGYVEVDYEVDLDINKDVLIIRM